MDIRQCKECGKLFQYTGKPMCVDCLDEFDKMFIKVRDHLYKNPDDTIKQVSEKTEIPEKYILTFLKEERLSLIDASGALICEMCKKPITSGRICENCREELKKVMPAEKPNTPKDVPVQRRGGRMHINKTTNWDED